MKTRERLRAYLIENRSSARMALLLRIGSMAISSVMSLVWTPLLLGAMGRTAFGALASFQGATRLATLGDFGISGAVTVRAGQMIGRGEMDHLRAFLRSARTVVLMMSVGLGAAFAILSPWLPGWLDFKEVPGTGSMTLLFCVGGLMITAGLIQGYFGGINLAFANVMWPILPLLFISQASLLVQWIVARQGASLWAQAIVLAGGTCLACFAMWALLKAAHPWLGEIVPLSYNREVTRDLFTTSGWVYLYSLGSLVFTTTDRLLVNAGFGSAAVPPYLFNYKLCEVAMQVILSASYVGQSKINQWIANPAPEYQERSRHASRRLLMFQSLVGTLAAAIYLAGNELFVGWWVGSEYRVPVSVEWAFATTLAVTTSGDAGVQIAGLCGRGGLRMGGIAIASTALLNFALSFIAMKAGSLAGIAWATVLAQVILSAVLGRCVCRHLQMSARTWLLHSCLTPFVIILLMCGLHRIVGSSRPTAIATLVFAGVALTFLQSRLLGVDRSFVLHELGILRGMWRKKP